MSNINLLVSIWNFKCKNIRKIKTHMKSVQWPFWTS